MNKVVIAMSGGVDSSAAAALLKQSGYDVTGVTMKIWGGTPSMEGPRHACYGPGEQADVDDAKRVADMLGIPFHVLDLSEEYESEVLDYFRTQYACGRTPNPCSRCNPRIKFGALARRVEESGVSFDYFATGHYARVEYDGKKSGKLLKKAKDLAKDQSYFLALLSREQIERSLFPLGEYTKQEVRRLAARMGLPVADKADSQDFAAGGYGPLVGPSSPGPILDGRGNRLGEHRGIAYYTVGQRRGLGLAASKPMYVTGIDLSKNAVIVGERREVYRNKLVAANLNWIAIDGLDRPMALKAKIRYRHEEADALVTPLGDGSALVEFDEPQMAITPGQTVVFYDGDVVAGGGTIEKAEE